LKSVVFVVVSKSPKQRPKSDSENLQRIVVLSQIKGIPQTIELFGQLRRGTLSPVQPCLL
jgi:hypothetical protein